jgi:hypothetical protein
VYTGQLALTAVRPHKHFSSSQLAAQWVDAHEPIVSMETFSRAQNALTGRKRGSAKPGVASKSASWLPRGIMRCGICGAACASHANSKGGRHEHAGYYVCRQRLTVPESGRRCRGRSGILNISSTFRSFASPGRVPPCAHSASSPASVIPAATASGSGAANNPFRTDEDAERLRARGIMYVPDFIANSGGLIHGASWMIGESHLIAEQLEAIHDLVGDIVARAERERRSPHGVAIELADERIEQMRRTSAS